MEFIVYTAIYFRERILSWNYLGVSYPEKTKTLILKENYTPVFTAAQFIITKTLEQRKCPLTKNG